MGVVRFSLAGPASPGRHQHDTLRLGNLLHARPPSGHHHVTTVRRDSRPAEGEDGAEIRPTIPTSSTTTSTPRPSAICLVQPSRILRVPVDYAASHGSVAQLQCVQRGSEADPLGRRAVARGLKPARVRGQLPRKPSVPVAAAGRPRCDHKTWTDRRRIASCVPSGRRP